MRGWFSKSRLACCGQRPSAVPVQAQSIQEILVIGDEIKWLDFLLEPWLCLRLLVKEPVSISSLTKSLRQTNNYVWNRFLDLFPDAIVSKSWGHFGTTTSQSQYLLTGQTCISPCQICLTAREGYWILTTVEKCIHNTCTASCRDVSIDR